MSQTAGAAAKTGLRRAPAPRAPRRVSGPARPGRPLRRTNPRGARMADLAVRIGDARLLDRLVRGRAWIAIVAVGLLGIVFMQVSMLKLNAGVGRAVTAADTLERQNATLRGQIAALSSEERIQSVAAGLGMSMPGAGDVHYLDARAADARKAARSITEPAPVAPVAPVTPAAQPTDAAAQPEASPQATTDQAVAATTSDQQAADATQATAADTQAAPSEGTPAVGDAVQQDPATTTTTAPDEAAGGAAAPQG